MNTPKFKEGDWIKSIHSGRTARVVMLLKTCYSLWFSNDDSYCLDYSYQDNWELTDAPPKSKLEEAAEEYARLDDKGVWKDGGKYKGFIAGAEWQKSQMLKDAVEGEVYLYHSYNRDATAILVDIPKENLGDKVRIVVLKEEEE